MGPLGEASHKGSLRLVERGAKAAKFTRRLSCRPESSAAYYKYIVILIPLLPVLAPLLTVRD